MRIVLTLWRRELRSALRAPMTWGVLAAYAAVTGLLLLLALHDAEGSVHTLSALYSRVLVLTLPPLTALFTMRSFAVERQTGTLETLLTAPVPDRAVVMAKFCHVLTLTCVALAASVIGFVLYVETARPAPVYSRTGLGAALVLLALHAAVWIAAGLLAALCSRRQAAAAVGALFLTAPHSLLAAGAIPGTKISSYFDALDVAHLARGVVDSRPILLCGSLLWFFLFAAIRALESRRWRLQP